MKRVLKWGFGLFLILLLAAGALLAHTIWFKPVRVGWFYEKVFLEYGMTDPQMLSQLGLLERVGIRGHNARLTDASEERATQMLEKLKRDLATLRSYNRSRLSPQEQLSYDILENFLAVAAEGERWRYHNYPMNQLFGVQNGLPTFMATTHRVEDATGAEHYLARLSQFGVRLDQAIEGVKLRESKGIIPPTFVVEKVLDEMRGFAATPARENILYTAFDENLGKLVEAGKLDEAAREAFRARAVAEIEGTVYPVYGRMIAYYESLLPRTGGNHGVWALPDGREFYDYTIRLMTTTRMSADELHAIGLAEVERIGAEMDAILRQAGFEEGTLGQRIWQLKADPAQLYPDSDEGRAQILADYQAMIDEIDAGLEPYFDVRPKVGVKVERVPVFREKTAPGAYYQPPSLDGSRPGVFYANLRDVAEIPRFGMRTLAYHEGVPGHHFQIAIMQELKGVPTFRRILPFTAYSEGWALYTEQLAWELGFQDDPLDNLGRLQAEMFRAVRLVVDTGMHAKRWTREQAIDYMIEHTGMGEKEVVAEIERYLVMPGQALAYKVGMLKLVELRDRARRELGDRFDMREFHNVVLTNGSVPLEILERLVEAWIAERKGATA
jgi:uncharacterized protein (DUF885 family)